MRKFILKCLFTIFPVMVLIYAYGFYVNSGGTYTAYAKAGTIAVTFWRNTSASDSEKTSKSYTYGGINQAFPAVGWQMAGYQRTR